MNIDEPLFQATIAGMFAFFAITLIKEAFAFIKGLNGNGKKPSCSEGVESCVKEALEVSRHTDMLVSELHRWHNVTDPRTGTMVWYAAFGTSDLKDTLIQLSETLRVVTEVLRNVAEQQKDERATLAKVSADLVEIKGKIKP